MRYKSFDPEAQVIGQAMLGFRAAAEKETIEPLLEKYGLTDIQPDQWYPLQKWLDVLSDISEQAGDYASMLTFVNIGQKVAASVYVLPEVESSVKKIGVAEILFQTGAASYFRDHQGNVGAYVIEKVDAKHVKCVINTPYPPDFWYGLINGSAKRYAAAFVVHYEDMAMRHYNTNQTIVIHLIVE